MYKTEVELKMYASFEQLLIFVVDINKWNKVGQGLLRIWKSSPVRNSNFFLDIGVIHNYGMQWIPTKWYKLWVVKIIYTRLNCFQHTIYEGKSKSNVHLPFGVKVEIWNLTYVFNPCVHRVYIVYENS